MIKPQRAFRLSAQDGGDYGMTIERSAQDRHPDDGDAARQYYLKQTLAYDLRYGFRRAKSLDLKRVGNALEPKTDLEEIHIEEQQEPDTGNTSSSV